MGRKKHIDKVIKLFEKSPVVDFGSIKRIVGDEKYAKQLIKNLILKNKLKRITKGYYTKYEDTSLMVFCFKPSYMGLQDALSIHDLWEQETNTVVITARKVRQGIRKVFGNNVVIRRIDPKYVFGFDYIKQGDIYYPVSDVEKTFIDMIYFRENMDKDLLKEFKKRIDKEKLKKYLKKYPKNIKDKVLKYI